MFSHFDTTAIKEHERIDYWMQAICRFYPHASGQRPNRLPFSAQLERTVLGSVEVSEICCSPLRYERRIQDLRSDESEDMLISYMLEGNASLEQGGRHASLEQGDIAMYDAARPFTYDFSSPYRMLLTKVPRRVLLSRIPDAERLTAIRISGRSQIGALASSVLRSAVSIDVPKDTISSNRLGISMVDILASAIEMELSEHSDIGGRQAQLLSKAKKYIQANLDEPDLNLETISQALHVSARTLSRAFTSENTTVIKWLWKERLEAGYTALSEGRATQVFEVAHGCGFTSGSHFSRLFKERYGVLPNTLLRNNQQPH